jgi:hemerythrin superfamily protein
MNRSQGSKTGRTTQRPKTSGQTTGRSQSSKPGRSYSKQVLEMLGKDHQDVKKLFRQGEKFAGDAEQLQRIVEQACAALTEHAEIEEEFFYPVLREKEQGLIAEAEVEHNSAKQLIADLQSMDMDDERYHATFKVLGEYVKHHIKEEEGELFPLAEKAKADFEPLYEALMARTGGMNDADEGEDDAMAMGDGRSSQARSRSARGDSRSTPRSGR